MSKEFIGVAYDRRTHLIKAIRASIESDGSFNVCAIHGLEEYKDNPRGSFAGWARAYHCKKVPPSELEELQRYLVNFFLCPDGDVFDVEAAYREIFATRPNADLAMSQRCKVIFRIGRLALVKQEASA